MKNLTKYCFFILFSVIVIIFNLNFFDNPISSYKQYDELKRQIEICCTWGDTLEDGILTFEIINAKPESKTLVKAAFSYWDQNLDVLRFKEADDEEKVDISVSFGSDNGKVAGQTITNFDSKGFIYSNKIFLAENAFTKKLTNNLIEYIAKHEIGHVLGLGHANFDDSLMSSLVYNTNNKIDQCDIEAVMQANKWKFIDNSVVPQLTKNKSYICK